MRITEIHSTIISQPWREPLLTSYGQLSHTTTVVVEIITDEGVLGFGQTDAPAPFLLYGDTAESIKANIDHHLAPQLMGQDPMAIEGLVNLMDKSLPGANYSKSAVEFALWDIKGKALNVPAYELLGGRVQEGVPICTQMPRMTPAEAAERVKRCIEEGWTLLKVKIGVDPDEDLTFYESLRRAGGDAIEFQVDGNCGYTLADAIPTLKAMERMGGLAVVEEPVRYLHEMAELSRRLEVPLMADESVNSPQEAMEVIRAGAAQVIHLKLFKYGGLLRAKKIAAVAEAAGLELSVDPYPEMMQFVAAHFAASTPNVTWPNPVSQLENTILAEPLPVQNRILAPPEKPGLGVELDRDALERYKVDL